MDFNSKQVSDFIERAMSEDIGDGDHSGLASIDAGTKGTAKLIFKDEGIAAGLELAEKVLKYSDPDCKIDFFMKDGDRVKYGDIGFEVIGDARAILKSERLLLNCMQRLSGIATITAKAVAIISPYQTKILDTRKTTPNIRFLEKWAVTVGGGFNHRTGLYDMIMLKDNHNDFAGGITNSIKKTHEYLKKSGKNLKIEVETRNMEEVKEVLASGGIDRIMLDNFKPSQITEALIVINKKYETEASGGITLDNIKEYAETGVDFISLGMLTHSVKSLDISLKVKI
ncbi:MAG: carboxylating nicotinate-nucleotide diphosphorylase [Bacteroidia bacterium]|nr:carboxylating nicotinate-nucleotide diphosphorylase [Bacteroidia bacterium]